jgi:hypothetical protein
VNYSPVVFSFSHREGFPLENCVLCLWYLDIYFHIYIALFCNFLVDSYKEGVCVLLFLPLKWYQSQVIILLNILC